VTTPLLKLLISVRTLHDKADLSVVYSAILEGGDNKDFRNVGGTRRSVRRLISKSLNNLGVKSALFWDIT
jgi:hypothetical protein